MGVFGPCLGCSLLVDRGLEPEGGEAGRRANGDENKKGRLIGAGRVEDAAREPWAESIEDAGDETLLATLNDKLENGMSKATDETFKRADREIKKDKKIQSP